MTRFERLNHDWNAEPNAPEPLIHFASCVLELTFFLNWRIDAAAREFDRGRLSFQNCWRYRLGEPNDEGWYRKQDRFSLIAPEWGLFYEITGDLGIEHAEGWVTREECRTKGGSRHYLFYFRDETFECDADTWSFQRLTTSDKHRQKLSKESRIVRLGKPDQDP